MLNADYKLWHRPLASAGVILVALLYAVALLAGFLSPYSPAGSPNRDLFYHPPTEITFRGVDGRLGLRPFVLRTYRTAHNQYATGIPLRIQYRMENANNDPALPDEIDSPESILILSNSDGAELGTIRQLRETDVNSSWFEATAVLRPEVVRASQRIEVRSANETLASFPVDVESSEVRVTQKADTIRLFDSSGQMIQSVSSRPEQFPIRLLVRGWRYRLFGLVQSDLHLFGVDPPGYIFLSGTDQSGRDILSRTIHGSRISLTIGIVGVVLSTVLGLFFGVIAGFYGKTIDSTFMRVSEILLSIPPMYLILSVRNAVPYQLQETYDKLQEMGIQSFAWQQNNFLFYTVLFVAAVLLTLWMYKSRWSRSRVFVSVFALIFLGLGPHLVTFALGAMQKILPGSTYITAGWTYFIVILVISLVGWAAMARVVRGMVYSLREEEYVLAARGLGASDLRLMLYHILPNTLGYVLARGILLIPAYILGEVALSFLGVGVQEPAPSWGNMLSAAQNIQVLQQYPWMLAPGIFIFLSVLSFDLIGESLRKVYQPRYQHRRNW